MCIIGNQKKKKTTRSKKLIHNHKQFFDVFFRVFCVFLILCPYVAPPCFPLPTSNQQFVLCVCVSVSFLLYSLVCFIFQNPFVSDTMQHLSLISFSIILSLSMLLHMTKCHFFMTEQYSIVFIYTTSFLSTHLLLPYLGNCV